LTSETMSKKLEVETFQGVVSTLANQLRYRKQKIKSEEELSKKTWVEAEESKLEESIDGRVDKEKKFALIDSARLEQTMLREAVRNLKIEKIRLMKRVDAAGEKRNDTEVVQKNNPEAGEVTDKLVIARHKDEMLGEELEEMVNVAQEHQEKLQMIANKIEHALSKKSKLGTALLNAENFQFKMEDDEMKVKDEPTIHMEDVKEDKKLSELKEKIANVEKEIEEKSRNLEDTLATIGRLIEDDKNHTIKLEEKKKQVEELRLMILLEKKKVDDERNEFMLKFEEERDNLARRELAVNISLANLNMDIEKEKTKKLRLDNNEHDRNENDDMTATNSQQAGIHTTI